MYIPEIIGALLLGIFFVSIIRQGKLYRFLRTGEVDQIGSRLPKLRIA